LDNSHKEQDQQEEIEYAHDDLVDSNIEYDIDSKPEKNNLVYRPKAEVSVEPVEQSKTSPEKEKPPIDNQKSPRQSGRGKGGRRGRGGRDGGQRETTNEVVNETPSEPVEPPKESFKESPQKPQEDIPKSPGKGQLQKSETGGGRGKFNNKKPQTPRELEQQQPKTVDPPAKSKTTENNKPPESPSKPQSKPTEPSKPAETTPAKQQQTKTTDSKPAETPKQPSKTTPSKQQTKTTENNKPAESHTEQQSPPQKPKSEEPQPRKGPASRPGVVGRGAPQNKGKEHPAHNKYSLLASDN